MERILWALALTAWTIESQAQDFTVPNYKGNRIVPRDGEIEVDSTFKKLYEEDRKKMVEVSQENTKLKADIEAIQRMKSGIGETESTGTSEPQAESPRSSAPAKKLYPAPNAELPSGVQTFAVSEPALKGPGEVLPAGSWVRAKLLTGVEANSQYAYEVTLQLDYAFTGPNSVKVDMQGCIMVGDATADLSIERVIIRPRKLSCVRQNGEYVERKVAGFVAGRDSAGGLEGVYSSKQGQVFLAALLASIASGAGSAVQMTQIEETVGGRDNAQVARNFKGDVKTFAAAKGVTDAATMITGWYLDRAKALLPTIKAGSGEDVWIILTDSVLVPSLYATD